MSNTKTQKAIDLFNKGDLKGALKIAKTFKMGLTKPERAAITRGFEAYTNPSFYKSIGYDVEELKDIAKHLFISKILNNS